MHQAISLRASDGLTYAEVGRAMGINRNRAAKLVKSALKRMQRGSKLLVCLCAVWLSSSSNLGENRPLSAETGESHQLTLADGSIIQAMPRTLFKDSVTSAERHVRLIEGEATFKVAKDTQRPFIVETYNMRAEAVGTEFSVHVSAEASVISVEEGIVKVSKIGSTLEERLFGGGRQPVTDVFLSAGQRMSVSGREPIEIEHIDPPQDLGWHRGWWASHGETIGEFVDQFNRRNTLQIQIDDPQLAQRRIVGYFRIRADNPESFVKVLSVQEAVIVTREGNRIHVRQE